VQKEFAETLKISVDVVKEYMEKLKNKGLLKRTGNNKTGYFEKTDGATGGAMDDAPPLITPSITPQITPPITELEQKVLEVIIQNPTGTRKEFAKALKISADVGKEYMKKLKNKGLLKRTGNNKTGYWEIKQ
jgi:predicted HTH transcriptional regulator